MSYPTVDEVAEQLHLTPDGVRRMAAEGRIPARKVGRRHTNKKSTNPYDRCMARFAILELDQLRGLPRVDGGTECGVYFLWHGPVLIYVGMSQNIAFRVGQHKYFGKRFTHATYEKVSWRCMAKYEREYIGHYEPPLNIMGVG